MFSSTLNASGWPPCLPCSTHSTWTSGGRHTVNAEVTASFNEVFVILITTSESSAMSTLRKIQSTTYTYLGGMRNDTVRSSKERVGARWHSAQIVSRRSICVSLLQRFLVSVSPSPMLLLHLVEKFSGFLAAESCGLHLEANSLQKSSFIWIEGCQQP